MDTESHKTVREQAEEVFADFLARSERGEDVRLEDVCKEHPTLRLDLEALHSDWNALHSVLQLAGLQGSLSQRLQVVFGSDPDRGITLEEESKADAEFANSVIARLSDRSVAFGRYHLKGEVARGAMGQILRVWDEDLRRHLAMKVLLRDDVSREGVSRDLERRVSLFLEEAQITGQLDHPGIVPVHEVGLDSGGGVYFTMKLVKGEDLREILDRVAAGDAEWSRTRVLGVLQRVCEALAYAHDKGVVHRDLKPGNVMVGRFGETYVMDWGLAKVLDAERPLPEGGSAVEGSLIDRERKSSGVEGMIVGTPAYMSPEQAFGHDGDIDERSDVYAAGAILYHLLAEAPPYCVVDGGDPRDILQRVRSTPPPPVSSLATDVPVELEAICEKAMHRDRESRYASMLEMASDLRAFLEGRVVAAYETGAWAETRKWIARNRGLASSLMAAFVILIVGLVLTTLLRLEAQRGQLAVLRLSAFQKVEQLRNEADELWPAHSDLAVRYQDWLVEADALMAQLQDGDAGQGLYSQLASLRAKGLPSDDGASLAEEPDAIRFETQEDSWWHGQLTQLIAEIERFGDSDQGLISGLSASHGRGVSDRLEWAEKLRHETLESDVAASLWREASTSIADPSECPAYEGLRIAPQYGLLPVGRDESSGLWEFAVPITGEVPTRRSDGTLDVDEETSVVLVLLPGGWFEMGTNLSEVPQDLVQYFLENEGPVHSVELDPFFISKYEMTQAQWRRLTGENPNGDRNPRRIVAPAQEETDMHPVALVSAQDCERVLLWAGLALPTEAQWEYAARAGTASHWWTGEDPLSVDAVVNLADITAFEQGQKWLSISKRFDDGWTLHAPVNALAANPFGLHHVLGNVLEWCADFGANYDVAVRPGDGFRGDIRTETRVARGGCYLNGVLQCRANIRDFRPEGYLTNYHGVRPMRPLVVGEN